MSHAVEKTPEELKGPLRILVAGGAGFIGSHLARRLKREGHHVVVADWQINPYFKQEEFCHEFHHVDLRVMDACVTAVKGCDWVFSLAADMGGM
jgi:GDP-D-mannose 3',5'-epimerase